MIHNFEQNYKSYKPNYKSLKSLPPWSKMNKTLRYDDVGVNSYCGVYFLVTSHRRHSPFSHNSIKTSELYGHFDHIYSMRYSMWWKETTFIQNPNATYTTSMPMILLVSFFTYLAGPVFLKWVILLRDMCGTVALMHTRRLNEGRWWSACCTSQLHCLLHGHCQNCTGHEAKAIFQTAGNERLYHKPCIAIPLFSTASHSKLTLPPVILRTRHYSKWYMGGGGGQGWGDNV